MGCRLAALFVLALGPRMRGVVDLRQMLEIKMRVDLRSTDIGMPKQLLHGAQISRGFEQMTYTRVAQQMRINALPDALVASAALESRAHPVGAERTTQATTQDQIVIASVILTTQGSQRRQGLSTDRHNARL